MQAIGQKYFTPYDDLPGIPKSYKPACQNNFPEWAKMLYVYPLNFNEISEAFQKYSDENPEEKSAVIRYYKIWSRVVEAFVNESGDFRSIFSLNALCSTSS